MCLKGIVTETGEKTELFHALTGRQAPSGCRAQALRPASTPVPNALSGRWMGSAAAEQRLCGIPAHRRRIGLQERHYLPILVIICAFIFFFGKYKLYR